MPKTNSDMFLTHTVYMGHFNNPNDDDGDDEMMTCASYRL